MRETDKGYKKDFENIVRIADKLHYIEKAVSLIKEEVVSLDKSFNYGSWGSKEGKGLMKKSAEYVIDCALADLYKTLKRLEEVGLVLRHKSGWFGAATVGMPEGKRNREWQTHCVQWEQYSIRIRRPDGKYIVVGRSQ